MVRAWFSTAFCCVLNMGGALYSHWRVTNTSKGILKGIRDEEHLMCESKKWYPYLHHASGNRAYMNWRQAIWFILNLHIWLYSCKIACVKTLKLLMTFFHLVHWQPHKVRSTLQKDYQFWKGHYHSEFAWTLSTGTASLNVHCLNK